ncbi:MAG TPA: TetR/AcrR family transcriptional regulator [Polyangiaceae bacterium]|jgi:AcrR family transcriptional regulator|nr:TetR/AcrR family transcriptional regulator [Polyangiaceae bacterium]
MVSAPEPSTERRAAILEAASRVFLRYGFKKTSMDDLARAAGLSRQGLYLHFPTKEALFKAAVSNLVTMLRTGFRGALEQSEGDVEKRLLAAFDTIHAHTVETASAENLAELFEAATSLVGDEIHGLDDGIVADVAHALSRSGVAARWKSAGLTAKALAENIYSTSAGIKHRGVSASEYHDGMRVALRIVCRGA